MKTQYGAEIWESEENCQEISVVLSRFFEREDLKDGNICSEVGRRIIYA